MGQGAASSGSMVMNGYDGKSSPFEMKKPSD
jgi:hypothetical protein